MTVKELLESAGISYTKRIASQIGERISKKAKANRVHFTQKQEFINVSDYPNDFVPEMEKIVVDYLSGSKPPKGVRIGKFFEPTETTVWVPIPSNMVAHVYANAAVLDIRMGERQLINENFVALQMTMSSLYKLFALGACCNVDYKSTQVAVSFQKEVEKLADEYKNLSKQTN